jgi:hypothetical protein
MRVRQILFATAIPVFVGTFGCAAFNAANAASPRQTVAQATQPSTAQPQEQHRPRIDFKAAATKLNVTEQQLKDALGIPATPTPGQRPPRPDFKAAAAKLNVSEQQLKDALGVPATPTPGQRPPHPDFKAAAAKLNVSEQQLKDALGVPASPQGDRPAPYQ